MRLPRKLSVVAAMTAALGASLVSAPSAYAAGGTAPACIQRNVYETSKGFDVSLQNNCGKTMRVQVVVNSGSDSTCYIAAAGASWIYVYEGIFGSYSRTAVC